MFRVPAAIGVWMSRAGWRFTRIRYTLPTPMHMKYCRLNPNNGHAEALHISEELVEI